MEKYIQEQKKNTIISTTFTIIRYIAGIFFLLLGMGGLSQGDFISAMCIILIGVLLTPALANPIEKKLNLSISAPLRITIVLFLFIGFVIIANLSAPTIDNSAIDSNKETIASAPHQAAEQQLTEQKVTEQKVTEQKVTKQKETEQDEAEVSALKETKTVSTKVSSSEAEKSITEYDDVEWINTIVSDSNKVQKDLANLDTISNNIKTTDDLNSLAKYSGYLYDSTQTALINSNKYNVSPELQTTKSEYDEAMSDYNLACAYIYQSVKEYNNGNAKECQSLVGDATYYINSGTGHTNKATALLNDYNEKLTGKSETKQKTSADEQSKSQATTSNTIETDSTLLYASSESNVYHNAGCSYVQRIKPENLITFDSVEEAEAAGYRACKKCGG